MLGTYVSDIKISDNKFRYWYGKNFMVSAMFTLEIGDDKRKVFDTSMKQNFEIHAIDVGKIKKIK